MYNILLNLKKRKTLMKRFRLQNIYVYLINTSWQWSCCTNLYHLLNFHYDYSIANVVTKLHEY